MADQPVTIERMRELLKQNAPFVYQQVTLHKPLEIEQKKIEVSSITKPEIISIKVEEDDFIKGLEEDQKRLDSQIES